PEREDREELARAREDGALILAAITLEQTRDGGRREARTCVLLGEIADPRELALRLRRVIDRARLVELLRACLVARERVRRALNGLVELLDARVEHGDARLRGARV